MKSIFQMAVGREGAKEASYDILLSKVENVITYLESKTKEMKGEWRTVLPERRRSRKAVLNLKEIKDQIKENGSVFLFYTDEKVPFWVNIYLREVI